MGFKNIDSDEVNAEINIIPLVDVILVVLIIFMVTAPLVMKPTIDINLPKAATGDEQVVNNNDVISITITPAGEFLFNGVKATSSEIYQQTLNAIVANPDTPAILMADKAVTLEKMTEVVDAVRSAGVKKVAFSIDKK